jgi:hypothetical protein
VRFDEKEVRFIEKDVRFDEKEVRFIEKDVRFDEKEVRFTEKEVRFDEKDIRFIEKEVRFDEKDIRFIEKEVCFGGNYPVHSAFIILTAGIGKQSRMVIPQPVIKNNVVPKIIESYVEIYHSFIPCPRLHPCSRSPVIFTGASQTGSGHSTDRRWKTLPDAGRRTS